MSFKSITSSLTMSSVCKGEAPSKSGNIFDDAAKIILRVTSLRAIDEQVRIIWRAQSDGLLTPEEAHQLHWLADLRKSVIKERLPEKRGFKPVSWKGGRFSEEIFKRRRHAALHALPSRWVGLYSTAKLAVLKVIGLQAISSPLGCRWSIATIAREAGVCRTTVQTTLRDARRAGLIEVEERRHRRQRSETNVIQVIAAQWRERLMRLAGRTPKGGGGPKNLSPIRTFIYKKEGSPPEDRRSHEATGEMAAKDDLDSNEPREGGGGP